ncbi:MAG: lysophospholipid acyltransferase family protein [Spartobacteria bacterium]
MRTPGRIPEISSPLLALFSRYAGWYVGKHFHAVRILAPLPSPNDPAEPLVVFLNHAAWWDPLVCLILRREFFPARSAYAPIEAEALERYRFLKRLGFFAVESGTTRGAAKFLKTSMVILERKESALFLTPQGRFADVRAPLVFAAGIDHLAARASAALYLPLAIEYSFWEERRPEVLLAFGEAAPVSTASSLNDRLVQLQARLAAAAARRQPNEWTILRKSRSGVNLPYDLWRGLRARLHGEAFRADHGRL